MDYETIVMGASAGGMNALQKILKCLNKNFPKPIIIVQHLHPQGDDFMARHLNTICSLHVKESENRETIKPGTVYLAPPNYHLLVEKDKTFSFSTDERVNYCRPSIDVLFESAADLYGSKLIGIILTGANNDGASGMKIIRKNGGLTIVQDPSTAEVEIMPESAMQITTVDYILPLEEIGPFLVNINENLIQKK